VADVHATGVSVAGVVTAAANPAVNPQLRLGPI
jgi:hypothetical protein